MSTTTRPEVGEIIDVRTYRFGRATVNVISIEDEWIEVEIVRGWLQGMTAQWGPGDRKVLRMAHCMFYTAART